MSEKGLNSEKKIAIGVCVLGALLLIGVVFGVIGPIIKFIVSVACIAAAVVVAVIAIIIPGEKLIDDSEKLVYWFVTIIFFAFIWLGLAAFSLVSGIALCGLTASMKWLLALTIFGAVYGYAARPLFGDKLADLMDLIDRYVQILRDRD